MIDQLLRENRAVQAAAEAQSARRRRPHQVGPVQVFGWSPHLPRPARGVPTTAASRSASASAESCSPFPGSTSACRAPGTYASLPSRTSGSCAAASRSASRRPWRRPLSEGFSPGGPASSAPFPRAPARAWIPSSASRAASACLPANLFAGRFAAFGGRPFHSGPFCSSGSPSASPPTSPWAAFSRAPWAASSSWTAALSAAFSASALRYSPPTWLIPVEDFFRFFPAQRHVKDAARGLLLEGRQVGQPRFLAQLLVAARIYFRETRARSALPRPFGLALGLSQLEHSRLVTRPVAWSKHFSGGPSGRKWPPLPARPALPCRPAQTCGSGDSPAALPS